MFTQLEYSYKKKLAVALSVWLFCLSAAFLAAGQTPTPDPNAGQDVRPENLAGVPDVAQDFRAEGSALPDLGRIGVDMLSQKPLALQEAIVRALENNKDIEVSRQNVRIAEFDLRSARGFYDPRIAGQSYFEQSRTPVWLR